MTTALLDWVNVSSVDGGDYRVPYWALDSGITGPHVLVVSTLHGNEVQGAEMLRRLLPELASSLLRGVCTLVPFANPVAVRLRQPHIDFVLGRYYGSDRENNVNCSWKGDPQGTDAQRLSHALFEALVEQATHCIDLHCWQNAKAATVLPRVDSPASMALAKATAIRFVKAGGGPTPVPPRPSFPCILTGHFHNTGRPAICIEFSGQAEVNEDQVQLELRALRNCLRHINMLPGDPEGLDEPQIRLDQTESIDVPAPGNGLFVKSPGITVGDTIPAGVSLGHVFGTDELVTWPVTAPATGCLFAYGFVHEDRKGHENEMAYYHPYVNAGESVATIVP